MGIEAKPTAWQHSITGAEMRAMISYPLLRYAIATAFPDADTYMFVGRIDNEPWIEVAAEDVYGVDWVVFHAMILTPASPARRTKYPVASSTYATICRHNGPTSGHNTERKSDHV